MKVYVVTRTEWGYTDEWYFPAGDKPTKAFTDRAMAERYRVQCEQEERRRLLTIPALPDMQEIPPPAWMSPEDIEELLSRGLSSVPVMDYQWDSWNRNLGSTFGGSLEALTSLSQEELQARLRGIGLSPFPEWKPDPADGVDETGEDVWLNLYDAAWWEQAWNTLGEQRADELWALLDRIQFFTVVEAELEQ